MGVDGLVGQVGIDILGLNRLYQHYILKRMDYGRGKWDRE